MCDDLTVTPIPHCPEQLVGEEVEKIRSEVEPRKKGRGGVYFLLPYSVLIGNKLN